MASDAVFPVDQLFHPIAEDSPCGSDIREDYSADSLYSQIKDARAAARAEERNNLFNEESSKADEYWRKIVEIGPKILENESKDLEIASWVTEALIRRNGFQGLRDGFLLIKGLIDNFWDNLYPLPDEDGIETRVACLTGLNGQGAEGVLIAPIRNVFITETGDPSPFSFWKYQQALEINKILDEEARSDKASKLGFNVSDIEQAVSDSSEAFYIDLLDDISTALETYREIGSLLDNHCGIHDSPPSSNIINILQEYHGAVKHLARYKLPEEDISNEAIEQASEEDSDQPTPQADGPVRNREDAFRKLNEISNFFRKTEPHSPIPYILDRAVKWGEMPLEELIRELIPDSSARDFFGSLTGVRTEDE